MLNHKKISWTSHEYGIGHHSLTKGTAPSSELPIRFELDVSIKSLMDFFNPRLGKEVCG